MRAKGLQQIPRGDRLVLEIPGGAGLGDPGERDAARIRADLEEGLVSAEAALRDYGRIG
jgi:N-methylhydantoinase B